MQYISLLFQIEEFDNTHVILCRVNGLMRHHTQTSIDHKEKKQKREPSTAMAGTQKETAKKKIVSAFLLKE